MMACRICAQTPLPTHWRPIPGSLFPTEACSAVQPKQWPRVSVLMESSLGMEKSPRD